jgi:hypothetical protein
MRRGVRSGGGLLLVGNAWRVGLNQAVVIKYSWGSACRSERSMSRGLVWLFSSRSMVQRA